MKTSRTRLACLSAFLPLALFSQYSHADAFRCGTRTVQEGMSSDEIEERCGKPDLTRTVEEPIRARLNSGASVQVGVATTHYWYYDRGPTQFVARLTVRESIAEEIEIMNIRDIESLPSEER